jgi:transcriptional regulator with XRE-family HTH domain
MPAKPSVQATQLAAELRQIRTSHFLNGEDIAEALGWSASKVSRYETARTGVKVHEVERLLDYYGIRGTERARLLNLAHRSQEHRWWDIYAADLLPGQAELIGVEQGAETISIWQPDAIPPLLQTGAYAEVMIEAYAAVATLPPAAAARLARAQARRKEVLEHAQPPQITMVLDEAVLYQPAIGAGVMREQLQQVATWADGLDCLTVHVLPDGAPERLHTGPFTVFGFGGVPALPDVVGIEHLRGVFFCKEERDTYLYVLAIQKLAQAALDPEVSRALILKAAESYGG